MAITNRTCDRLERLTMEIEWLQNRLAAEGFQRAADELNHAKSRVWSASTEVRRKLEKKETAAA